MGRTSLPEVSAKFVADVEGMLQNLKRAENATRSTSANIDKEVGTLTKKLGDKFKLADFGKDVLKGAGLFGGFDIARTAAEAIAGYWEKAAESAKAIEESTSKSLEATMKAIAARETDAQKETKLLAAVESARKKYEESAAQKMQTVPLYRLGVQVGTQQVPRVSTDEEKKASAELLTVWQAADAQLQELQRKQRDTTAAEEAARGLEAISIAGDRTSRQLRALEGAQEVANQRFKEWNEIIAENKPLKEYEDRLERISFLEKQQVDETDAFEQSWKAKVKAWSDLAEAVDKLQPQKTSTKAEMKDVGADQIREADELMRKLDYNAQEMERIVGRAADGMADAWVDSLKGVEGAWSNLADTIITEIMRVAAQILIVKPMINGLGGILSGLGDGGGILGALGSAFSSYGGAKASGGAVGAGFTYRVNEDGQEYFKPNVGGTIIPVGASAGLRGGGGDTFAFNYNFASGIQRQDIMPILSVWQRETLAKIADAKRRRTSYGAALA